MSASVTVRVHCRHCTGLVDLELVSEPIDPPNPQGYTCPFCAALDTTTLPGTIVSARTGDWLQERRGAPMAEPFNPARGAAVVFLTDEERSNSPYCGECGTAMAYAGSHLELRGFPGKSPRPTGAPANWFHYFVCPCGARVKQVLTPDDGRRPPPTAA